MQMPALRIDAVRPIPFERERCGRIPLSALRTSVDNPCSCLADLNIAPVRTLFNLAE